MNRKRWLQERRKGLGGSDIGAVVGLDPYRGPLDVYLDKVGEAPPDEDRADLERGRALEPLIAKKYALETGRQLFQVRGLIRHTEYGFLIGTPDRRFLDPKLNEEGMLEIKSQRVRPFTKAKREGLPAHFVAQLQWYLALAGRSLGAYALFSAENWEMIAFDVEANAGLQKELLEAGRTFWNDNVLAQRPPTNPYTVPVEVVKSGTEIRVLDTAEMRAAVRFYAEARDLEATGKELTGEAKAALKALIGEHGAVQCQGAVVYFAQQAGRVTLDRKALAAAQPIDRQKLLDYVMRNIEGPTAIALHDLLTKGNSEITLDLAGFEKQGSSYDTLRVYLRGEEE